jgi:hemerythrin
MAIEWRENLETGIDTVDDQHRELFSRFNKLLEACNAGKGREEVLEVLLFLNDYIRSHFSAEEELQTRFGYPDYPSHHVQHNRFIQTVEELERQFKDEGATIALVIQTNHTMVNWLIQHIGKVDRDFARFVRARNEQ